MSCSISTILAVTGVEVPDTSKPNSKRIECAVKVLEGDPVKVTTLCYTTEAVLADQEYFVTGKFAYADGWLVLKITELVLIKSLSAVSAGKWE